MPEINGPGVVMVECCKSAEWYHLSCVDVPSRFWRTVVLTGRQNLSISIKANFGPCFVFVEWTILFRWTSVTYEKNGPGPEGGQIFQDQNSSDRSPEVIRPLAKYYCFLWAMAIVGHRKGAQ